MACNPPSKMQSGVVRNFEEKSVGEGEKILILKGGLCYGGISSWKNGKLHDHSIKNNSSNLLWMGPYTIRSYWGTLELPKSKPC